MLPASFLKRTYWLFVLIITIPMLFFTVIAANDTKENIIAQKERMLMQLVVKMNLALPAPYNEILRQENALHRSEGEKLAILHQKLQPIVDKLAEEYPGFGLCYGIENWRLAAYPRILGKTYSIDKTVYSTKSIEIFRSVQSPEFDGQPSCLIVFPLIHNGHVFGHITVSSRMQDIQREFCRAWGVNLAFFVFVWVTIVLMIHTVMSLLRTGHQKLAEQIKNHDDDQTIIDRFPEMAPVFSTVIELRENLQKQKNYVQDILNGVSDGFLAVDRDGRVTIINESVLQHFKLEHCQVIGKQAQDVFPINEVFANYFNKAMRERVKIIFEAQSPLTQAWFETTLYPLADGGLSVCFSDITQRKQSERELARLEVMNLLGQMAAGISHEVRNPMTTVRGYLQLMAARSACTDKDKQAFALMIDELDRANAIITEFLAVARTNPGSFRLMDIKQIILALQPLLETAVIQGGHQLVLQLKCQGCQVLVNEKEIRQLLLNLVKNAIEAMETPGKVTICSKRVNDTLILTVSDQGKGIPDEIREKIGRPFFTTKPYGTGLGLSTCYAIARRHNAILNIQSSSQGTTISVAFPLA